MKTVKDIIGTITAEQYKKLDKIEKDKANKERLATQKLDKDAFLKLMTMQLKYQNPLDPMDNKDMMAQMAQFTSVEQLKNLSMSMEMNSEQNYSMIEELGTMRKVMQDMHTEIKSLNKEIAKLRAAKVNE